ncbi:hypothetical protein [Cellulomonas sp. P5_C6]
MPVAAAWSQQPAPSNVAAWSQQPTPTAVSVATQQSPTNFAAWPPEPANQGRGGGRTALIIVISVIAGIFVIGLLAAIAIPVFLNQRAKAELSGLSSVTCESIGAEAVATSQAGVTGDQIPLTSVSGLTMTDDRRPTMHRPSPGSSELVMSCSGTALWQDGVTTPLDVELYVDSAMTHTVSFTWE